MRLMRAALGNPDVARLETVWAAAALVRWALAILIALYAYQLGGAGAVGVVAVVRMVPAALLAPRLSLVADQRSRRGVLLVSLGARLLLALGLWVVVVRDGHWALLLVLAAAFGVADSLQKPAQAALFGVHARNPTELAAATTLWSMLDNAAFLAGSLLVGVLVTLTGLSTAFAACLVPLVLAIVVLLGLPRDTPPPPLGEVHVRDEMLAGVRTIMRSARLRLLTGLLAADVFVQAVVDVLLVIVAIRVVGLGEAGAGWLSAAWGAGGILGGLLAAALHAQRRLGAGIAGGLVCSGLPLLAIALWPDGGLAVLMMIGLGIGFGVVEVALLTLTQRLVAADVLARVYGAQETLTIAVMALGSVVASGLVLLAGERGALVVAGLALPAVAVVLVPAIRRLGVGVPADHSDFELLRGVAPFATLPVATVETLAVRADRRYLHEGEDVVTQGAHGDAFFVIVSGVVEVFEDGMFRRRQGPGEFFGEIALLRDCERTATVRAASRLELLLVSRGEFLAAVAHPRTRHGLDAVATQRLGAERPASRT